MSEATWARHFKQERDTALRELDELLDDVRAFLVAWDKEQEFSGSHIITLAHLNALRERVK